MVGQRQSCSAAQRAFDAVADWVRRYRSALVGNDQLTKLDGSQVAAIAKDLGITAGQLSELASKGDHATAPLQELLAGLGVDPKEFEKIDIRVARDMQWLCVNCNDRSQCNFDLSIGIAATTFREYCPNAVTIDEVFNLTARNKPVR